MDWADDIAALLVMLMPGQEEGNAAAAILFGEANPSARLPLTFPSRCTHACPPILLDVSPFPLVVWPCSLDSWRPDGDILIHALAGGTR